MSNSKQAQKIIFPDKITVIISKILERHGLKETGKDIIQKLKKQKTPIGEKISKVIAQRAMEEISTKETPSIISKSLGVSDEIAKNLANDIEKEIMIFVKKIPAKEEIPEEKEVGGKPKIEGEVVRSKESTKEPELKPKEEDKYREPIE